MNLQFGSKGDDVKKLQAFLGLPADGDFGHNTDIAVKNWQTNNGLAPDGIVGPKTRSKMGLDNENSNTGTPPPPPEEISLMKTSNKGINLIKEFEGCRLNAYPDPGTGNLPITIGYGNTSYENGDKIQMGDTITMDQANALLLNLLPKYESIITRNIEVELNQNQFDALISFVWNTGGSQTLFGLINSNSPEEDIYKFWTTHYIQGGGNILPGLVKRRKIEADLYIS